MRSNYASPAVLSVLVLALAACAEPGDSAATGSPPATTGDTANAGDGSGAADTASTVDTSVGSDAAGPGPDIATAPDQGSSSSAYRQASFELCELINAYRIEEGLPAIPLSKSLFEVAEAHLVDFAFAQANGGLSTDDSCNLHSWFEPAESNAYGYADCCFPSNFSNNDCMWNKPREISPVLGATYDSNGYENSAYGSSNPEGALSQWKQSSGHNPVILNEGIWADYPWQAMGCGADVDNRWYFVWFGTLSDPNGTP